MNIGRKIAIPVGGSDRYGQCREWFEEVTPVRRPCVRGEGPRSKRNGCAGSAKRYGMRTGVTSPAARASRLWFRSNVQKASAPSARAEATCKTSSARVPNVGVCSADSRLATPYAADGIGTERNTPLARSDLTLSRRFRLRR